MKADTDEDTTMLNETYNTDAMEVLSFWYGRFLRYDERRLTNLIMEQDENGKVLVGVDALASLVAAGLARRAFYGPSTYGHTDYFLTDKGLEFGEVLLDEARLYA